MKFLKKLFNSQKLDKRRKYKDLSKDSQQIAPQNPTELFLCSRNVAGLYLQDMMNKFDDFKWLRSEYTYPSFDDMIFECKNNVFSVIIDIQDEDGISYLPEEFVNRQLFTAKANNLIPCKFPIIVDNPRNPDLKTVKPKSDGWNLLNTETNQIVIPEECLSEEKIEMSDWEMRNFGVKFIISYLKAKNLRVHSFQDTLEVDPQIWFSDEAGKKCWLVVRCERYSENGIKKPEKINEITRRCFKFDGYYAGIMLESKEQEKDKLYRNISAKITFDGIEKIHTTL